MKKLALVLGALACAAAIVILAVACVQIIQPSPDEMEDLTSDSEVTIAYREAGFFGFRQGFYAYNLGSDSENLTSEDVILRCWGWDEATAGRYAREGRELDTITEGADSGTYCTLVKAEEVLS